ncbi:unnamed protein product [Caretta caretta]
MPRTARPPPRGPWTLRCLAVGTSCCSLALLLVAMTSPRWLLIDSPDDGDHSGVWWLCSRPVRPGIGTETPFVKAIRALLLFALLASSVAVASLLVSVRPFARWRGSRFLVSATANFIAGLLVLISVVIFTAHVMLDSVNPQARASFEWAFFLAWTLSPLFVLSGCPPVLSPRVGPWGQPSQDLGETLAQGELEGGARPQRDEPQCAAARGQQSSLGWCQAGAHESVEGKDLKGMGTRRQGLEEIEDVEAAVSRFSACLSFLLLSAALLGPSWRDGGHPQDAGVLAGLCTKPACGNRRQAGDLLGAPGICLTFAALAGFVAVLSCCSRLACDLLISAAASFTAGLSGLTAMVLYTLAEPGHAATLNITWIFCLASSLCP